MSAQRFTLEYFVKVNGGSQAASQINGVNNALKMNQTATVGAAKGAKQLEQSQGATAQKMTGTTRSAKALTFGLVGLTSSLVEAIGMFGMYQDAAKRTDEAHKELAEATKKYGAESKEAKDATRELADAERALNMVRRNTILSAFDMVTWITLTINGIISLRRQTQLMRSTQQAATAMTEMATLANQRNAVSQQLANVAHIQSLGAIRNKTIALGAATVATNGLTAATSRLWLRVLGPIAIAIGGIVVISKAWKENWLGLGTTINKVGVQIGNMHPILKSVMEIFAKVGESVNALIEGRFADLGQIWSGQSSSLLKFTELTEEQTKAIQELDKASADYVLTLSQMDKKEMKNALTDLGIKGSAGKMMKGALQDIEKIQDRVTGFSNAMMTLRQVNIWDKFGLKDTNAAKISEKIFFTFEKRFDNISEMFKKGTIGKDLFNGLEETMRKAAQNSDEAPQIIANYLANNPKTIQYLSQFGFDEEAKQLQAMADSALGSILKTKGGTHFKPNEPLTEKEFAENAKRAAQIHKENMAEQQKNEQVGKDFAAGIVKGFQEAFSTQSLSGVAQTLKNTLLAPLLDKEFWKSAGATVVAFIGEGWGIEAANLINTGVVALANAVLDPTLWNDVGRRIIGFIGQGFMFIQQAQASLAIGLAANILDVEFWKNTGATIAGFIVQGFSLFGALQSSLALFISNLITPLLDKEFFKNVGSTIAGFIVEGLNILAITADSITKFITNITDAIVQVVPTLTSVFTDIVNAFIDGIVDAIESIADIGTKIWNPIAEKVSTAASTSGGDDSGLGSSALEDFIEGNPKQDKPIIDKLLEGLGGILPIDKVTLVPKIIEVMDRGGIEGNAPGSTQGAAFAVYIGADPTVTVPNVNMIPQQISISTGGTDVNSLISPETLFNLAASFTLVVNGMNAVWIQFMTGASNLANVTVQAIALVFGGMVINISMGITGLGTLWSVIMNSMIVNATSAMTQVNATIGSMIVNTSAGFTGLGNTWSVIANSFINNTKSATTAMTSLFNAMVANAISAFKKLGSNWASTMSKMVSDAKSAVSKINSELDKLERTVTTVHEIVTKEVGAARGFQGIVSSPTNFTVGEGGKPEFVSVTPMSHFTGNTGHVTTEHTIKNHGGNMGSGGGPTIVQVFLDGQQVQGVISSIMVRNQAAFK